MNKHPSVSASIVTFHSDLDQLKATIDSVISEFSKLETALGSNANQLILVDNNSAESYKKKLGTLVDEYNANRKCRTRIQLILNRKNKGFGYGHNIATRHSKADYHLITNPDIRLHADSLAHAVREISADDELAMVLPVIFDGDGNQQHLHSRVPSLADILLRSIAPSFIKRIFSKRLEKLRDVPIHKRISHEEKVVFSGCLMMVNKADFLSVGGFDENYFLYFEDYDLSLRMTKRKAAKICKDFHATHFGGNTYKKNIQHKIAFLRSYLRFFHHNRRSSMNDAME